MPHIDRGPPGRAPGPASITMHRLETDPLTDDEQHIEADLRGLPGVVDAKVHSDRTAVTVTCSPGVDEETVRARAALHGFDGTAPRARR